MIDLGYDEPDVFIHDDGHATIDQHQVGYNAGIVVKADERRPLALALLGGLTDELVERCSRAIWNPGEWDGLSRWEQDESRATARNVLEAAFGVAAEGGD